MEQWLIDLIQMTAPAVIGWLVGRRQQKAVTTTNELDNIEKALKIWREMNETLAAENRAILEGQQELKQQISDQESEISALRQAFETFVKSCPNNCPAPEIIKPRKIQRAL